MYYALCRGSFLPRHGLLVPIRLVIPFSAPGQRLGLREILIFISCYYDQVLFSFYKSKLEEKGLIFYLAIRGYNSSSWRSQGRRDWKQLATCSHGPEQKAKDGFTCTGTNTHWKMSLPMVLSGTLFCASTFLTSVWLVPATAAPDPLLFGRRRHREDISNWGSILLCRGLSSLSPLC